MKKILTAQMSWLSWLKSRGLSLSVNWEIEVPSIRDYGMLQFQNEADKFL